MSRGCWSEFVLDSSEGLEKETSGWSFSMKDSGLPTFAGVAETDDMVL